ncbi:MAG: transglutaminase family protein [Acidimicrobiales bacterium]
MDYENAEGVPSLWQVRPRPDGPHRVVAASWEPPAPAREYLDAFGNVCDRLTLPPGASTLRFNATVEVPATFDDIDKDAIQQPIEELPDEAFVYLLPSRFCWPDLLYDQAWKLFGTIDPGWSRVQAVSDWVHGNVRYEVGASTPLTTASDVWEARAGVCRDLTQLMITLCRALNVPARYIAGYLPDIGVTPPELPMDFCSWLEVWLDGRWWTFDPRNNEPRTGRVVIARGRDALDAAMVTTWGEAELRLMEVWADEVHDV